MVHHLFICHHRRSNKLLLFLLFFPSAAFEPSASSLPAIACAFSCFFEKKKEIMTFLIVLQGVQTSLVKISNLRELRILKKIRHIEVDNCTAYQTLTSFFIQNLVGHVVDYLS